MKIHSNSRKFLAVLCTLAMLASLMLSFGINVSAAYDPETAAINTWDVETHQTNRTWEDSGNPSNNTIKDNRYLKRESHPGEGHGPDDENPSDYVAVAKYTGNDGSLADGTLAENKMTKPAAARLNIQTNSDQTTAQGKVFMVVFWYKVVNMPCDAEIQFYNGSLNWISDSVSGSGFEKYPAVRLKAGQTTGWVQAVGYLKPTSGSGLHLALVPSDNSNRAGMEVWFDDFEYYQIGTDGCILNFNYTGAPSTISVRVAHGKPMLSYILDAGGTSYILYDPTRAGFTFTGWYDLSGNQYTVWPANNVTLYAHWEGIPQTVTFHGCGATWQDSTTSVTDDPETAVSVADPARDGYTFLGWSTVEGDAESILDTVTVPAEVDLDVYAIWEANDLYQASTDTQTFEESTDFTGKFDELVSNNKNIYLDNSENHTRAGGQSLRIDMTRNYHGELTRPRLILRNGNSSSAANFVAQNGESYRISFWVKSTMSSTSVKIYVAALNPSTAASIITMNQGSAEDAAKKMGYSASTTPTAAAIGYNAVHTKQTLTAVAPGMTRDNNKIQVNRGLTAGEWTKIVIDIDSFAGWNGADSLVELGIADPNASGSWEEYPNYVIHHSVYIDDISIVKKSDLTAAADALDYQSFENVVTGTNVNVRAHVSFSAVVADDGISHNAGMADANGKAVKITQTGADSGVGRVQMYVTDKDGNKIQMESGKQYLVSFWAYNATPAVVSGDYVRPAPCFWIAPGNGTNAINAADGTAKNGLKVYEYDTPADTLEPGVWRRYTFVTSANNANGNVGTSGYEYMVLGIGAARSAGTYTQVFYIDDIAVTDIDHALTKPSGNVALYTDKTTGSHVYNYTNPKNDSTYEVSAFRVFGGYRYNKFDYKNTPVALIKSGACPIVGRGIILAQGGVAESDMTVDTPVGTSVDGGKILQNQYVEDDLGRSFWGRKQGVMTYSMYVRVQQKSAGTVVRYRPYITVSISTYSPNATGSNNASVGTVTLYGDRSGEISLNRVAEVCGHAVIDWTA